jgi:hypothetical protein
VFKTCVVLTVVALNCATEWNTPDTDPHNRLLLANDRVRVYDFRLAPHDGTGLYAHDHEYLSVTLGAASVSDTYDAYGHRSSLVLSNGEVRFMGGTSAHSPYNDGQRPLHEVTIDFVHPSTTVLPCTAPCLFTSDQWKVSAATLAPAARLVTRDGIVVAVSNVSLTGEGSPLRGGPGTVWRVHGPIANVGLAEARFVLLEFK